jgi:hypothetical protein
MLFRQRRVRLSLLASTASLRKIRIFGPSVFLHLSFIGHRAGGTGVMIQSAIGTQLQESNIVSDRVRINRAQLHEKAWARPMTTLAEEFGVSGRGLVKSASAFDVPVPPRGYWAKLQNRALPTLVAALRSLPCSFPGSAGGGFGT